MPKRNIITPKGETTTETKRIAKNHYLTELPNIFKPIARGAREKGVSYKYQNNHETTIEVWMWKQLDIADQDLFLTIISLVAEHNYGKIVDFDNENPVAKELREKLELRDLLFDLPVLKFKTTIYKLLEIMGKSDNKQTYLWCVDSLTRLSRCGLGYDTKKYKGDSNLISYSIDKTTNEIHIAINPVSASVFLGNDKYVIHYLNERFSLKMECAKALQTYLNNLISPGQNRTVKIETISNAIYGPTDNRDTLKNRLKTIKKAMIELCNQKEYKFSVGLNGLYNFKRVLNILKV